MGRGGGSEEEEARAEEPPRGVGGKGPGQRAGTGGAPQDECESDPQKHSLSLVRTVATVKLEVAGPTLTILNSLYPRNMPYPK